MKMPRARLRRLSWRMWAVLAFGLALVVAGLLLLPALMSPGRVIRGELKAAADDLQEARAKPDSASLRRLRGDFPHHAVTVDARAWPEVAVTLHGLPRDTCRAAAGTARRIEGLVVVELERYRSADECGASNNMTWRFMP